jgi:hypothetical protein
MASHLRLWIADEGEPFDLVMDTPIDLICGDLPEPGPMIGRAGLTDFMTGKDPAEVHPEARTWFDNVWISRPTSE